MADCLFDEAIFDGAIFDVCEAVVDTTGLLWMAQRPAVLPDDEETILLAWYALEEM